MNDILAPSAAVRRLQPRPPEPVQEPAPPEKEETENTEYLIFGAAERAKNEMLHLQMAHFPEQEADTNFAGLMSLLMGKLAVLSSNPYDMDAYEAAHNDIERLKVYAEQMLTALREAQEQHQHPDLRDRE